MKAVSAKASYSPEVMAKMFGSADRARESFSAILKARHSGESIIAVHGLRLTTNRNQVNPMCNTSRLRSEKFTVTPPDNERIIAGLRKRFLESEPGYWGEPTADMDITLIEMQEAFNEHVGNPWWRRLFKRSNELMYKLYQIVRRGSQRLYGHDRAMFEILVRDYERMQTLNRLVQSGQFVMLTVTSPTAQHEARASVQYGVNNAYVGPATNIRDILDRAEAALLLDGQVKVVTGTGQLSLVADSAILSQPKILTAQEGSVNNEGG